MKDLLSKLDKLDKTMVKQLDATVEGNAREIEAKAKANAPVGVAGSLRQSGFTEKVKDASWKTGFSAPYAGYIEFGTGSLVSVPAELSDVAKAIQANPTTGTFEQGLQSIKDWCRAKGIDEKAAYPIFVKILNVGIRPQPFLYPAFKSQEAQFLKDVDALVQQQLNKI